MKRPLEQPNQTASKLSATSARAAWQPITIGLLAGGLVALAGGRVAGLLASTGQVAALAIAIALPIGTLLAMLLTKTNVALRRPAMVLLGAMLLVPLYLHAATWQAGFGLLGWATIAKRAGQGSETVQPLLAGWTGAAWIHALAAVPWVVLIVAAALRTVSRQQEESALLDTTAGRVLRQITLRRAALGCLVAALWVAVQCAAEMTVTDLLQVRTFAEEIYTQAALGLFNPTEAIPTDWSETLLNRRGLIGGLLLVVLLGTTVLVYGSRFFLTVGGAENEEETTQPWRWHLAAWRPMATTLLVALLLLVIGLPIVNLAYQAGIQVDRVSEPDAEDTWHRHWSLAKLGTTVANAPWEHRRELLQSLRLGIEVGTTATLLGLLIAWKLRTARRTKPLWLLLLAIGLTIPGPLLGILAIRWLNQPLDSPLARLTWFYDHTLLGPWLVQMIRITPLAALVLWPAMTSLSQPMLDAAASEGIGPWRRLAWIILPLRWRALASAWLITFAASAGELSATLLTMPPGTPTATIRIFSLLHYGVDDRVAGICLVMLMAYSVVAGGVVWLLSERQQQLVR